MSSILITGGAGFIGVNAAAYFASRGWQVAVLDNLSRRGTDDNLVVGVGDERLHQHIDAGGADAVIIGDEDLQYVSARSTRAARAVTGAPATQQPDCIRKHRSQHHCIPILRRHARNTRNIASWRQ